MRKTYRLAPYVLLSGMGLGVILAMTGSQPAALIVVLLGYFLSLMFVTFG